MAGLSGGRRTLVAIVGLHYAVNFAHGVAHGGVPVPLTPAQTAFVLLVVALGPLAAIGLHRSGRSALAWGTLAAVLAASFCFGVAFHYVVASPDHVANVPAGAWHLPFVGTAALAAVVDGIGAALAAIVAFRARSGAGSGRGGTVDADDAEAEIK